MALVDRLISGFLAGVVGFSLGVWAGGSGASASFEAELVERGLAIHCPSDGAFAFKGECEDASND